MPAEQPIDMLNNTLKEIVFRTNNLQRFKQLSQQTYFNYREVEGYIFFNNIRLLIRNICITYLCFIALAIIHRKCIETLGPMNRLNFRDIFHSGFDFTENIRHILIDRVFSVFDRYNALTVTKIIIN